MLDDERKRQVVSNFTRFISTIDTPVQMIIVKESIGMKLSEKEVLPAFPAKFYLVTDSRIDDVLSAAGYRFSKLNEVRGYEVEFARRRYVVAKDRSFLKGYAVTGLSAFSNVGFITSMLDYVDRIYVWFYPLPAAEMEAKMGRYKQLLEEKGMLLNRNSAKLLQEIDRAAAAYDGILKGVEKLFRIRITYVVRGTTHEEMRERAGTFLRLIQSNTVKEIDTPRGALFQKQLVEGTGKFSGADLYITTRSVPALFPFISADMVDETGVWFGNNSLTGGPIIYDPFMRSNYNMAIVAQSGGGKSMLIKTFVSRMLAKYPDACLFVIESVVKPEYVMGPDGTYEHSFGGLVGCDMFDLAAKKVNFDPMLLFKEWPDASSVIASLADIRDDKMRQKLDELVRMNPGVPVPMLVEKAQDPDLKTNLGNMCDKFRFMLGADEDAKPLDLSSRMIFDAHQLPDEVKEKAVSLMFLVVQKKIDELPTGMKKILVIDEAWAYLRNDEHGKPHFPAAAEFMKKTAKTGRHNNVLFIVATQSIRELVESNEAAKTVIGQAATRVFLKNNEPHVASVLENDFGLSTDEVKLLEGTEPGEGILIAEDQHYKFYNRLSGEEMARFTTKPSEVSY